MPKRKKRVTPWLTLSIAQGNALQIAGLLGAAVLTWQAGREGSQGEGERGARWIVASRLLAYFSEHAFSHWLVGRIVGIRFTGYGLHGTSHPQLYPMGLRWVFSHLPLLSARVEPASLSAASPAARARCTLRAQSGPCWLASQSRPTRGGAASRAREAY
jgi:hypothetical protein